MATENPITGPDYLHFLATALNGGRDAQAVATAPPGNDLPYAAMLEAIGAEVGWGDQLVLRALIHSGLRQVFAQLDDPACERVIDAVVQRVAGSAGKGGR